ncbi:MAG: glycoside hydrolase family 2 [Dysgonamonadaceae bacterium]|jgi:hypothetical protein|nr:glycoside hydrolase family 2 [Dysgonamonadaceae bacterium]
MWKIFFNTTTLLLFLLVPSVLQAQKTELKYLSGIDCNHPVDWRFLCTEGRNSGQQTTLPVPSNWELHGFGKYNYGQDKDSVRGKEQGLYRYEFNVPTDWKNKQVNLVFEGSMTDTKVKVNGKTAGDIHQGAFYRFKYDVSKLLKYGSNNLLEVTVSKHSENTSVNKAERFADFWIFGGIYRPVYLEAKPEQNIIRTAINAKADGSLDAAVFLHNIKVDGQLSVQLYTLQNEKVGSPIRVAFKKGAKKIAVSGKIDDIKTWNPESPNLYRIVFTLSAKDKIIHETDDRIGFRTVEIRKRDGIYVNGVKVKLKGVCHHTFWPTSGRASSKEMSVHDIMLIKDMNMNAVRTSHYPPDEHFLQACDSLGLFVLDELAGWHNAYDTPVGKKLVQEMVVRDVNRPSVILWDNGNEGGHNYELDAVFSEFDIQQRPVVHPWQTFNDFDNQHYINYDYGSGTYWHGHEIVFPTEFLHGLYDGGLGAGLYDYWELMWNNPRAAGGFLWVFADEGVVRTDKDGSIDTDGSHAPDGILGPFHEKEGSYFAIKEIWAPIRMEEKDITPAFDGRLNVENRYFYTNLNRCTYQWKLARISSPDGKIAGSEITGKTLAPDILPGCKGTLKLDLPLDWNSYDVLYLTSTDRYGHEIFTWSWPLSLPRDMAARVISKSGGSIGVVTETNLEVTVSTSRVQVIFDKKSGLLKKVTNPKGEIPFNNGPVLCAGIFEPDSTALKTEGDTVHMTVTYTKTSKMKELIWSVYPSGIVRMAVRYNPEEYESDMLGVNFSYPEADIKAVEWLGKGPYRVWKNRMHGGTLDVHRKVYNNTMTGISPLVYPEFKGYHAQLYWAKFITSGQPFFLATENEDVFLRLYTPLQPESVYNTAPPFPSGDISLMQGIPAIGTKSQKPENMGPSGKKNMYFDYGQYDKWQIRSLKMVVYFDFGIHIN